MASAVDICNLALQRLGAKSIGALTEDTTAGRECNRVYEHARDSELRSHQWSFARTRVEVAADSVAIEGRKILTNDTAPLQIIYLKRVTDPNVFDELFIDLLVSRIAMDVAEKITQSNTKKSDAQNRYVLAKREAKKINAYERPPQELPVDGWVAARL